MDDTNYHGNLIPVCIVLFGASVSRRAIVNLEGAAALSFLLAIIALARRDRGELIAAQFRSQSGEILRCCLLVLIALAAYWRSLGNPLLFDDYVHLVNARDETWAAMIARSLYTHPQGGDYFFRPLGYLSYWVDFHWAGVNPALWHAWNLLIHSLNSVLVYVLARQLRLRAWSAFVAAACFALHASHVEVVCWMAARFDLLAFFFSVLSLIALKRRWWWAMICACLLALLSKESAFCLPLLALCLILFEPSEYKKISKLVAALAVTCLIVFLYRVWFLGGIGGYQSAGGAPALLHLNGLKTIEGLLFREWAILFFPVNWSMPPGYPLLIGFTVLVAGAIICLKYCRPARLTVVGCIGLVLAASLPVTSLLLIDSGLTGSRVLYLPTLGLALLAGLFYENCPRPSMAKLFGICVLMFQLTALEHNVGIWDQTASMSKRACMQIAGEGEVTVADLPRLYHGVYFLANGFPQCVLLNGGKPVQVVAQRTPGVFVWNDERQRMEQLR